MERKPIRTNAYAMRGRFAPVYMRHVGRLHPATACLLLDTKLRELIACYDASGDADSDDSIVGINLYGVTISPYLTSETIVAALEDERLLNICEALIEAHNRAGYGTDTDNVLCALEAYTEPLRNPKPEDRVPTCPSEEVSVNYMKCILPDTSDRYLADLSATATQEVLEKGLLITGSVFHDLVYYRSVLRTMAKV